jgi:hypothetical protein
MPRQALSKEEQRVKRQEEHRRYIANPEALQRRRGRDRLRKREKRRQDQLIRRDPLSLLADATTQEEILKRIHGEEERTNDPLDEPAEAEEVCGPIEQEEDGPIMEGFGYADWDMEDPSEERGTILDRVTLT